MLVDKFNFTSIEAADRVLGPMMFFFFIITVGFFLMNFLISVIEHSLSENALLKGAQNSKYHFGQFFLSNIRALIGIHPEECLATTSKAKTGTYVRL